MERDEVALAEQLTLAGWRIYVTVAVINDNQIEWSKGYGMMEAGKNQPVTTETLFHACSVAKPVSAAGVLTLVEDGLLDLDENVNDKLVSWQVPENAFTEHEKVTIRCLLSHTSGLNDGFESGGWGWYATEGAAPHVTVKQMLVADPLTGINVTLMAYPETGQGAVVRSNTANGSAIRVEIWHSIAIEYGWPLVVGIDLE